ncbi:hypothetical protein [Halobacillus salinarum]|nr:hypothetical protein [Halobacillus salinarum]
MRLNFILFTVFIEWQTPELRDQAVVRKQTIEKHIDETKIKQLHL